MQFDRLLLLIVISSPIFRSVTLDRLSSSVCQPEDGKDVDVSKYYFIILTKTHRVIFRSFMFGISEWIEEFLVSGNLL